MNVNAVIIINHCQHIECSSCNKRDNWFMREDQVKLAITVKLVIIVNVKKHKKIL